MVQILSKSESAVDIGRHSQVYKFVAFLLSTNTTGKLVHFVFFFVFFFKFPSLNELIQIG